MHVDNWDLPNLEHPYFAFDTDIAARMSMHEEGHRYLETVEAPMCVGDPDWGPETANIPEEIDCLGQYISQEKIQEFLEVGVDVDGGRDR